MCILNLPEISKVLNDCTVSGWNISFVNVEKETKKIKNVKYKYKVYSIGLDNKSDIKRCIHDTVVDFIENKIEKNNKIVKFDPENKAGTGTVEYFDTNSNDLSDISELKSVSGNADLKKQLNQYKYYLLKNDSVDDLFIIKKVPNFKKIYAGFLLKLNQITN